MFWDNIGFLSNVLSFLSQSISQKTHKVDTNLSLYLLCEEKCIIFFLISPLTMRAKITGDGLRERGGGIDSAHMYINKNFTVMA